MGQTSENVANQFNISREQHDLARDVELVRHILRCLAHGLGVLRCDRVLGDALGLEDEIVPVRTQIKDPKTGEVKDIVVVRDDGIRYGGQAAGRASASSEPAQQHHQ
jgi:acetyl-CoA acyltransferase 1